MQKPIKRGDAWRIQVKFKHLRDAATRDTSEECIQWPHRRLMELQRIKMDMNKLIMN